jgi:Capsule assembly protein Wzi
MKIIYLFFCIGLISGRLDGQMCCVEASLGVEGLLSTPNLVPFWMRSDHFGSFPLPGPSASFLGSLRKDYDTSRKHIVDWGASLEARANVGQIAQGTLVEGYGKLRVSIFELMGGREKQIMGLVDTSLSSGAFAISGNALGIPQVQIRIPDYFSVPILGKLFSFKGNFGYGWLGEVPIQTGDLVTQAKTYFYQQSLYGRFGKPGWKLKFKGGINRQGFWGNEKSIFGTSFKLSPWQTYEYALLVKTYHGSKIGKQMGSADLGVEYDFDKIHIMFYRQFFIYIGAFFHLANFRDGLYGLSIVNKKRRVNTFGWRKLVVEVFHSKDQAGYPWSIRTPSGDENYYNNFEYAQGWSYKGLGLGNPFITPRTTTRAGFPNSPTDYFNNNRVLAFYTGMECSLSNYAFTARFSYSLNYGTFATSQWGSSRGSVFFPPIFGQFQETNQFSGYLGINRTLRHGLRVGIVAAVDHGGLFYNTTGVIVNLFKSF